MILLVVDFFANKSAFYSPASTSAYCLSFALLLVVDLQKRQLSIPQPAPQPVASVLHYFYGIRFTKKASFLLVKIYESWSLVYWSEEISNIITTALK